MPPDRSPRGARWRRRLATTARSAWEGLRLRLLTVVLGGLVVAAIVIFLSPWIFVQVPAGNIGVLYRPWGGGTVTDRALSEGNRLVLPWNRVTNYDARILTHTEQFEAITRDDLHIKLQVTYRFRTRPQTIGTLHKTVGPNYRQVLLDPSVSSSLRQEVSKYTAVEVYGSGRSAIQKAVYKDIISPENNNLIEAVPADAATDIKHQALGRIAQSTGSQSLVELMDVLITSVILPDTIRAAIERKKEAEQLVAEYDYRIAKEELESRRKEIEGRGIAAFQRQVEPGITPSYLKWRGIEATLALAGSENSKVVIVGGQNGLPLIFNSDDVAAGKPKPRAAPGAKAPAAPKAPE